MKEHRGYVVRAARLLTAETPVDPANAWSFEHLVGRLVEVSEEIPCGALTFTAELLRAAQEREEPVAWVSARSSLFYPPDFAENGIDVGSISVVTVSTVRDVVWAGDLLARSGAFGMVVLDIGRDARIGDAEASRLVHLARKHRLIVLFLTMKRCGAPSLSSLVSVHAAVRSRGAAGVHVFVDITLRKDKRRNPGLIVRRSYETPPGMS